MPQHPSAADLPALLAALCDMGVEFIVVGGAAAVIHGAPVTTNDLDIVHRRTTENLRAVDGHARAAVAHLEEDVLVALVPPSAVDDSRYDGRAPRHTPDGDSPRRRREQRGAKARRLDAATPRGGGGRAAQARARSSAGRPTRSHSLTMVTIPWPPPMASWMPSCNAIPNQYG